MVQLLVCLAGPLFLAPLLAIGMKRLYELYVRHSAAWFAGVDVTRTYSAVISTRLVSFNIGIYVLAWYAAVACACRSPSLFWSALVICTGLLIGLIGSTLLLRSQLAVLGVDGRISAGIGLFCYACANLPLIVVLAVVLMLC